MGNTEEKGTNPHLFRGFSISPMWMLAAMKVELIGSEWVPAINDKLIISSIRFHLYIGVRACLREGINKSFPEYEL